MKRCEQCSKMSRDIAIRGINWASNVRHILTLAGHCLHGLQIRVKVCQNPMTLDAALSESSSTLYCRPTPSCTHVHNSERSGLAGLRGVQPQSGSQPPNGNCVTCRERQHILAGGRADERRARERDGNTPHCELMNNVLIGCRHLRKEMRSVTYCRRACGNHRMP